MYSKSYLATLQHYAFSPLWGAGAGQLGSPKSSTGLTNDLFEKFES